MPPQALPTEHGTACPLQSLTPREAMLPLDNVRGVGGTACAKCRKCFSESVLVRQQELLERHGTT